MEKLEHEKNKAVDSEISSFSDLLKFLKTNYLLLILFFIVTFSIYANVIPGKFLNLDDIPGIVNNQNIGDITLPLKNLDGYGLYTSVIYKLFGINSVAYHFFSVLLHALNSILVFIFTYIVFGQSTALITTFLFITHPANTEAVSWISGRGYLIRAIIIFNFLIYYSIFRKTNNRAYLYISLGIFLFGMFFFLGAGWFFITLFVMVLIDQFIFEKKIEFKNIKIYLPFIIISLIFAATLVPRFFKKRVTELSTLYYVNTETATPLINRIPYTIYMEYKTLIFPKDLSIYHEGKMITNAEYALMVVATVVIIFLIFYLWKRNRVFAGLMLIIIFSILPSFSPTIIAWTAAERYLYIPSAFFSMIVALLLISFEKKYKIKKFATYATVIIILLYSIRTIVRTNDYKNSKNMWFATRKTAPYSYRVYNNLGDVYANEGNYDLAIENFKKSVALKPDYADAVHNIGHIYLELKDYEKAKKYLSQALEMNPRLYPAAYKLGLIAFEEKDYVKAKEYFEKCMAIEPTETACTNGLSSIPQ